MMLPFKEVTEWPDTMTKTICRDGSGFSVTESEKCLNDFLINEKISEKIADDRPD
ncbi:MAG: hypothetical protein ACKOAO_00420 [Oxalobacteraceae bacterium]